VLADILAVVWKERKSLFKQRGSRTQVVLTLLVPVGMFAIYIPWQAGVNWFEDPLSIIAGIFIPMLLVGIIIPESFAGERERHTLETLLASRLPDRAILFGKMAVAVGLGWGMSLLAFLVGFVIVNATHWSGQLMFYKPIIAIAFVVLSLLMAVLTASAGIRISLRAATVREAQQTLMAAVMFPPLLLGVVGTLVFTIEGWRERIMGVVSNINSALLLVIAVAVLLALCLVLLRAAMARFQRARLILS
jgi:ABC-2 type transport system permease protein